MSRFLGFNVEELLDALAQCRDVHQAFASEYGHATRQYSALKDELARVEQALKVQEQISGHTGQAYPGTTTFRDTLSEAWNLASNHREALAQGRASGRKETLKGILQAAHTAFEKEVPRLQVRLANTRHELLSFNVGALLQRAFTAESTTSEATPGLAWEKSKELEQIIQQLSTIAWQYKRAKSAASRGPVPTDRKPDQLDAAFEGCMTSTCALIGLPTHYLASMPIESLTNQLSPNRWTRIVQSSSMNWRRYPNSSLLEPHATRTCHVKVQIEGFKFVATSYAVFKRCCYWLDSHGLVVVEHKLPQSTRKCFAYSLDKPLTLSFLDMQDLVVKTSKARSIGCKPQYTFVTSEDHRQFQSDIRSRDLLHEVRSTTISSKNTSRGLADCYNECIKVWDAPPGSIDRSLSFPAAITRTTKEYEIPLKWFNLPPAPSKATTVRLELATEHTGGKSASIKSFLRKKPSVEKTPTQANYAESIHSVNTSIAESSYAPREWIDKIGYIDIKFASAADATAFVAAIAEPFTPATPATLNRPPSLSGSPSTISTVWSSSPVSFQSMPRRPVVSRTTSTAGTSPMSPQQLSPLPDAAMGKSIPVMEKRADDFSLPQAGMGGLAIKGDEEMQDVRQAQTPSSLLRDASAGRVSGW